MHVGLGEQDGVAALRHCEELAQVAQHVVLLAPASMLGPFVCDDEGHRVHAEAGDAELQPEAHDAADLLPAPPGSAVLRSGWKS